MEKLDNKHKHAFKQGKWTKATGQEPTVLVCDCGALKHVNIHPDNIIVERTT